LLTGRKILNCLVPVEKKVVVPSPDIPEGRPASPASVRRNDRRYKWALSAALALAVIAVSAGGLGYYGRQQRNIVQFAQNELGVIADLKVNQILNWRREREFDADFFFRSPLLADKFRDYISNPANLELHNQIVAQLDWLIATDNYDQILLLDPKLRVVVSLPFAEPDLQPEDRELILHSQQVRRVVFSDLHRSSTGGKVRLDMVVPVSAWTPPALHAESTLAAPSAPMAIILFRLSVEKFLFPLLQSWPTPSSSAETLLIRREGNQVVFLNELRHRKNTALSLRFPIGAGDLPAGMAARDQTGIVTGVDYRGTPVLAALRAIPGTPWRMVAKVDEEEIFAPLRREALTAGLIVGVLLLSAILGIGFLWSQQDAQWLRRELDQERDRLALAERVRHLNKHASDTVLVADRNWRILEANDKALEAYGYSLEEIRRLAIPDLWVPESKAEYDAIARVLKEEGRAELETNHRRKDGSTFPVEIGLCRIETEGREFYQGIIRDISERKAAEAKIRHLNQLLLAIRDINRQMVRQRDPQHLLAEACEILVRTRGYRLVWFGFTEPGSMRVIPIARAGPLEDYLDEITVTWDESPTGLGPVGTAIRNREARIINDVAADPSFAPWKEAALARGYGSVAAFPLIQAPRLFGALAVYADRLDAFDQEEIALLNELTADLAYGLRSIEDKNERRRTGGELQVQARYLIESDIRYWELFENANDIIFTIDLNGNFTSWNKAGERITGFTSAEALQMNVRQVMAPEYVAQAREHIRRMIAGESLPPTEFVVIGKNGTRISVEVSTRAIVKNNKPVAIQGISRDLTERNMLQRQFLQSQKMEAIGRLAGGIAHDFNNLLTIIIGSSDFLLADIPPDSPIRADVEQIQNAGNRAAALTSKLLAFSRKQTLQLRVLDLNAIVEENSKLLRRLLGEDVKLVTVLSPDLGSVKVDMTQMEQIIMNLAVNARDAMPKGGKLILETANVELDETFVSRHAGARPGKFVMLAAGDTGTGMDVETKAHAFEPFFTTKEEGKGTGLGLATVYGIVKGSGGYIAVDSEPGCGATFRVYLPQVEEPAEQITPAAVTAAFGSETVLFVEDADEVRALACRALQAKGYRVLDAKDGPQALKIAAEFTGTIDLLATDLLLQGGINGRDLAGRLQTSRPGIRVLFTSAYASAAAASEFLDPSIAFLQKPYTGEDLARKVRAVVQNGASQNPGPNS
jgi:PAS domain S-box-containing protein